METCFDKFPMNDKVYELLVNLKSQSENRRINQEKVFK